MLAIFHRMLDWFRSLFWKEEMELTLVGLQYSGKTTFVNVIAVSRRMNCVVCVCHCDSHSVSESVTQSQSLLFLPVAASLNV